MMRFEAENLCKQIAQLHKQLKRFPRQPLPEDVHRLRRQIRTLEAIVDALTSTRERKLRRLLKALILISKAAGKVRDTDVFVGLASSLATRRNDECLVQLLEYLGERRFKAAAKLHAIISAKRQDAFHSLKQCSRLIDKNLINATKNASTSLSMNLVAVAQAHARELSNYPRLNKDNLHSFRLKVKELRSIIQLLAGTDTKFIAALGKAKDEIGAWHDWNVLAAISERVVGRNPACRLQKQVQLISREKLKSATAIAHEIRKISLRSVTFSERTSTKMGRKRPAIVPHE
jgi:CHAD domain-containing protein